MHVLLVDDHVMFREGLAALILREQPQTRIAEAGSLDEARRVLESLPQPPDLVLLDLNLGQPYPNAITDQAMALFTNIPVVVLSGVADPRVVRNAIEAGAMGFIPKSLSYTEFSTALTRSLAGDVYLPQTSFTKMSAGNGPSSHSTATTAIAQLTNRQREVLRVLARGWNNRTIARHLNISSETVKSHLSSIFMTLGVNTRTEAVYLLAQVEGL